MKTTICERCKGRGVVECDAFACDRQPAGQTTGAPHGHVLSCPTCRGAGKVTRPS